MDLNAPDFPPPPLSTRGARMRTSGSLLLFVFLTQMSPAIRGSERTWTRIDGATIGAEMMGVRGESVLVQQGNRRLELPFRMLTKPDRDFVFGWLQTAVKNTKTSGYPFPTMELNKDKRDRYTMFVVNGVRTMTTDVHLHSTVIVPFFSVGSNLRLRMVEPDFPEKEIDRARIQAVNQVKPTSIPSLPRDAYLKMTDDLAASIDAVAVPLTWDANGILTAESSERLRLVRGTLKNVEDSSLIRDLVAGKHPKGLRPPGDVERSSGEIRFKPTSEYWTPAFPQSANRSQCEQAYNRSRDAMREIDDGARLEGTPFKWKALSADIRLLEGVFRQCCGFLHEWRLPLESLVMKDELYAELSDDNVVYFQRTISE